MRKYLFVILGIILFFALGFIVRILIFPPPFDKVIKMKDYELRRLSGSRDLISTPQKSGSNIVFDASFLKNFDQHSQDSNEKIKKMYNFALNGSNSRKKEALSFDFSYPSEYFANTPWLLLIFTNISLYNKPEGFFNLGNYDSIQIPISIALDRDDVEARIELAIMVSTPVTIYSSRMVHYQFLSTKKLPVNKRGLTNIVFPFDDFRLDTTYQPTVPLSRISGLQNVRLSDNEFRGYLFQYQFKLLFNTTKASLPRPITGSIDFDDPVIYKKKINPFLQQGNLIFGLAGSLLFIIVWLASFFIRKTRQQFLRLKIRRSYLEGKKKEVSRIKSVIEDTLAPGGKSPEEMEGYYHWELKKDTSCDFKGIQREGFSSDKFVNSLFFEKFKETVSEKNIMVIIDYDQERNSSLNYLMYYYNDGKSVKFPSVKVTRKSYWFYLLAFLIYTPRGFFNMTKLDYQNVVFNKFANPDKGIPCLRVPQNNNDLGIDNEKYLEMARRYDVETIIDVVRKQKEKTISYSLLRDVNYTLFVHSKLVNSGPFIINDTSIMSY